MRSQSMKSVNSVSTNNRIPCLSKLKRDMSHIDQTRTAATISQAMLAAQIGDASERTI
jgi:hypothetical protein